MPRYELVLPAMGEGIIEAAITRWLVSNGQTVTIDQPLVEIATDKVDSEISSPVDGTIIRLVYHEGEIPRVGEVIALIETGIPESNHDNEQEALASDVYEPALPKQTSVPCKNSRGSTLRQPTGDLSISPLVRLLAKQRGLSGGDLNQVRGTGLNGLITKEDINHFIAGRSGEITRDHNQLTQGTTVGPDDKVEQMSRMRKLIAGHMVNSKREAPHVTSFLEADISALVDWREKNKVRFFDLETAKLTFTPVFIKAVALALVEFPGINVSISGDSIILRKNINIGVATALPDGNLVVPVIRNADQASLGSLARMVADMANRARNNSLLPAEIKGGTFTITNIGQYNNLTGTPIINQPESAILAIGTITKKPWAVKTPDGYGIAVRDIVMLSLTYDHRVINGALGGSFLSKVAWRLENFDVLKET